MYSWKNSFCIVWCELILMYVMLVVVFVYSYNAHPCFLPILLFPLLIFHLPLLSPSSSLPCPHDLFYFSIFSPTPSFSILLFPLLIFHLPLLSPSSSPLCPHDLFYFSIFSPTPSFSILLFPLLIFHLTLLSPSSSPLCPHDPFLLSIFLYTYFY